MDSSRYSCCVVYRSLGVGSKWEARWIGVWLKSESGYWKKRIEMIHKSKNVRKMIEIWDVKEETHMRRENKWKGGKTYGPLH